MTTKPRIKVDPEFSTLLPPLRPQEREPLVVWAGRGILLDGHQRFEICTRLGIAFRTVEVKLKNRKAALLWIEENQLGRINLTPDQVDAMTWRMLKRQEKRQQALAS